MQQIFDSPLTAHGKVRKHINIDFEDNDVREARKFAMADMGKTKGRRPSGALATEVWRTHIGHNPSTFKERYTMPDYLVNIDDLIDKI